MSKIKITMLLLGGLLLNNTNLHAVEANGLDSVASTTKKENIQDDNGQSASEADGPVTKGDINGIHSDEAQFRDQLSRTLEKNVAATTRSLKIGGTFTNRYSYTPYTNQPPVIDGFVFNAASLTLKGNLQRDYEEGKNLDYAVSFQAASTAYNLQPTDVYIQYSIFQTLDIEKPLLYLQFGQQKKPFGLEPTTTDEKQPTINGATFAGAKGLNLSQRDIGLQLHGDLLVNVDLAYNYRNPLIEYSLAVYNGSGPNATDTNQSKDVVGRLVLNAPADFYSPYRGLSLGTSFYKGKQDISLLTLKDLGAKDRYGIDLAYVSAPIGFSAEYAAGRDEYYAGKTLANPLKTRRDSQGYTLTLFYEFGEQFQKNYRNQARRDDWWPQTLEPFIRFDYWDPDKAVGNNETTIITYGLNYFFAETTKLQLNYAVRNEKATGLKQNDLTLQFQYGF